MTTVRLNPIGFWSYARQDDEAGRGRLSALRSLLKAELQMQYGRDTIAIFQDIAAIPPGAEWETAIHEAIDRSTFLIPIITPAFIQSEWCSQELKYFLVRERQLWKEFPELNGKRRIFPILYRSIQNIDPYDPDDMIELGKLQRVDFRELRHKSDEDEEVQKALERLSESLCSLLQMRVTSPEDRAAAESAKRADAARAAAAEAAVEAERRTAAERAAVEAERKAEAARQAEAAREAAARAAAEAAAAERQAAVERAAAEAAQKAEAAKEAEAARRAAAEAAAAAAAEAERQRAEARAASNAARESEAAATPTPTPMFAPTPAPAPGRPGSGRVLLIGGGVAAAVALAVLIAVLASHPAGQRSGGASGAANTATASTDASNATNAPLVLANSTSTAAASPDPAAPLLGAHGWSVGGLGCGSPLVFTESGGALTATFSGSNVAVHPAPSSDAGVVEFQGDDGSHYVLMGSGVSVILAGETHPEALTRCG